MTVRIGPRTRRRVSWALGGFTVVWVGLWITAVLLSWHGRLSTMLVTNGIFLIVFLPVVLILTLRVAGNTRVGPDGLRLRAVFTRGFLTWDEIVEIKDRFHQGRGNGWWSVEAHLVNGRARRLPGFYCESPPPGPFSGPNRDHDFDDQLMDLRLRLRQWRKT